MAASLLTSQSRLDATEMYRLLFGEADGGADDGADDSPDSLLSLLSAAHTTPSDSTVNQRTPFLRGCWPGSAALSTKFEKMKQV